MSGCHVTHSEQRSAPHAMQSRAALWPMQAIVQVVTSLLLQRIAASTLGPLHPECQASLKARLAEIDEALEQQRLLLRPVRGVHFWGHIKVHAHLLQHLCNAIRMTHPASLHVCLC